nr:hypothetical protein Cry52Nrm3_p146 [Cryptomonas curvata]
MAKLNKMQYINFFYNICKIDVVSSKKTFGNFYTLFLSNLMATKRICFSHLFHFNPRFTSIYIFLTFCNGNTIKKILNCRIIFLFYIKNLHGLKNNNILFKQRKFLVNFTRVLQIIIIKTQSIDIKIYLFILIGQDLLDNLFDIVFNFKTGYYITIFFFYVILKILLNLYKLEYCSFNTDSSFHFIESDNIDCKKPFIIFRLLNLIIKFYKKVNTNLISKHIYKIFNFFLKCRLSVVFFKKKIINNLIFSFIGIQNNGNDNCIYFSKIVYNKYINMILYLNGFLVKEKNKLFVKNKNIKIKPVELYKIIKIIKNNIPSNSCAFEIFKIKEMISYSGKKFKQQNLTAKKKLFPEFFT